MSSAVGHFEKSSDEATHSRLRTHSRGIWDSQEHQSRTKDNICQRVYYKCEDEGCKYARGFRHLVVSR